MYYYSTINNRKGNKMKMDKIIKLIVDYGIKHSINGEAPQWDEFDNVNCIGFDFS